MARKVIISNTIKPRLAVLDPKLRDAIALIFQYWAPVGESQMKIGARWTDRTGVARAGLVCEYDREDENTFALGFASMASYGIWLEIRWSGKYAIVGPVMSNLAPRMAKMIADTALP